MARDTVHYYMLRVHKPIISKKIDSDDVNKYTIGTLFKEMLQLESIQNPLVRARKADGGNESEHRKHILILLTNRISN